MKKVLVLFGKGSLQNKKPFIKKWSQECYEYFYNLARKHKIEMYRASYQWYDLKKKLFKYAWVFKNNKWKKVKNTKPDLIYDKTNYEPKTYHYKKLLSKKYKIINDPKFTLLAGNKFFTSLILPEFFKRYYKVTSNKDLKKISKFIRGDKIVLKPISGSGGKEIKIIHKSKLDSVKIKREMIAQEFIDSSCGIKGIVAGIHDLRLIFVNNKLIYSYIRQPSRGSLLSNIAQGGSMFILEKRRIPKKIFSIVKKVQNVFKSYKPKIYTIDFIFNKKQRPWIIELNTMPGLYYTSEEKKYMIKLYLELIKVFKKELS